MMINKKGQTLIMFVVLIPLLLVLGAFVVDIAYITENQTKLTNTTKVIIQEALNKDLSEQQIKLLYEENEIDTTNLNITKSQNILNIRLQYYKPSIFGGIVGIKKYKIKVNMKGIKKENKIIIEKE